MNSQTLAADQLPAHQHEMDGASVSSDEHSHGVTVDASATIVENVNATPGTQVLDGTGFGGGSSLFGSTDPDSHDHTISGNTGTGVGLVGNAIDNRPAYYTLAFIIKL